MPAVRSSEPISQCASVGTARLTASTRPISSRQSVNQAYVSFHCNRASDLLIQIANRDELCLTLGGERRMQTRVLFSQMANADHRCAQSHVLLFPFFALR